MRPPPAVPPKPPKIENPPVGHVSVLDTDYDNYLTIVTETRKLYWDGKEIVVRNTIELIGSTRTLGWIATVAALFGAVAGLVNGFVNLNKETCWVEIGSCNVAAAPVGADKKSQYTVSPPIQPSSSK